MPLSLLLALFLAFGLETDADSSIPASWPRAELWSRASETVGGILLVAVIAFVHGRLIARRVNRAGRASPMVRRAYVLGARAVDLLSLGVFAWIIHDLQWPRVVRSLFGMSDPVLIDDVLVLLPFLLAQISGWWGLYAAEHALRWSRGTRGAGGLSRHLVLKARQTLGIVLPVAAFYGLGTDVVHRLWPRSARSTWDQPVSLVVMTIVVLVFAPALVRLAWPTRPLQPGPLRNRLERMSERLGFRCTNILVWDTNGVVVNAGVTGSIPWFRYVLLTDALIENLNPLEIEAVFGHEVGHVAHRHLAFFGFFLIGSLGLVAAVEGGLRRSIEAISLPWWLSSGSTTGLVMSTFLILLVTGGYFLFMFGYVSRRFERQADVFGCRAVSCGLATCPPHSDPDGVLSTADGSTGSNSVSIPLCSVGIEIFVSALHHVALLNGINPSAWSWRHGSILRRTTFLEGLEGRPDVERTFQAGVKRLRWLLSLLVVVSIALVFYLEQYR